MAWRVLLLGAALSTALATEQSSTHFELDLIFPRNETYLASDAFPIAFALQNATAADSLGDFIINWGITGLEDGHVNRGRTMDSGAVAKRGVIDRGNYTAVVTYTDAAEWVEFKRPGDVFSLKWYLSWPDRGDECEGEPSWDGRSQITGEILFSVETEEEHERSGSKAVEPDVAGGEKCPVMGSAVEIRPNSANSTCPQVLTGMEATPCMVVVDDEFAESIESEVAKLAAPAEEPSPYIPKGEDQEDAAGFGSSPVRTAIAAACAITYMALAS